MSQGSDPLQSTMFWLSVTDRNLEAKIFTAVLSASILIIISFRSCVLNLQISFPLFVIQAGIFMSKHQHEQKDSVKICDVLKVTSN